MSDLPGKLDRLVHKAGLDVLTPYGAPKRRNLRWLPLVILLALPAGYALLVVSLHRLGTAGLFAFWLGVAGSVLFFLAYGAAPLIRLFGPRVGWEGPLDERELILKARAGSIAGSILAALCVLGCFYGGYAAVFGAWMPTNVLEWVDLGLIIWAYALTLPVLVASWLQRSPDEEE